MKKLFLLLSLFFLFVAFTHPFDYDMHVYRIDGTENETMLVMHGMGGNFSIADVVKEQSGIEETLISFNFPDFSMRLETFDPKRLSYGTINELLPALWLLRLNVDKGLEAINLYGYSAGGGAIINMLAVLNSSKYDRELKKIGFEKGDKKKILKALENGYIILDTPLKSIQEIMDERGPSPELEAIATNYQNNEMEPIDALSKLKGLNLNIIVYFQNPDTVLTNRDDALYIELLKKYNGGNTYDLIGNYYGHKQPHPDLWQYYFQIRND